MNDDYVYGRDIDALKSKLDAQVATITALQARVGELEGGLSKAVGALIQIEIHTDCEWTMPIAGHAAADALATLGDAA